MEFDRVESALEATLTLWEAMKHSDVDDAGDDADRFQMEFYQFIDVLRDWAKSATDLPQDSEEAKQDPRLSPLFERMPSPLAIPFETELDEILADRIRHMDSTEQG